ncbi:hypothetical protein G4B88_019083 [Cannabis sativa]|uniref:TCP domain-containing protein n=1 Tax=Cannabis sativa TaxID=3483 RepID=A0A7J6H1K1_CANSA|nr:hypothetical protein G4B88_019083 [Cannabis sativa]
MVREEHLGYDRPSKAVDWLIKKAKNSIDKLAELPPWHPTENLATEDPDPHAAAAAVAVDSTEMGLTVEKSEFSGYNFQLHRQLGHEHSNADHHNGSGFIPHQHQPEEHLGYDRPSKAVDWLIKKAKNSIDKLAELPPWHPTENLATEDPDPHAATAAVAVDSTEMGLTVEKSEFSGCIDSWAMSTRTQIIITGRDSFLINISRWIPTP